MPRLCRERHDPLPPLLPASVRSDHHTDSCVTAIRYHYLSVHSTYYVRIAVPTSNQAGCRHKAGGCSRLFTLHCTLLSLSVCGCRQSDTFTPRATELSTISQNKPFFSINSTR